MALLLLFLLPLSVAALAEDAFIGVNIGTDLSNMPSPTQVVALLKSQQIRHVRLYDADRAMLLALANTGIRVTVSVPNNELLGIGQSNATAANWVARNVVAHVPATNITAIAIGSEVITSLPNAAPVLVSALQFIHSALVAANLDSQIKVSTPHSSAIILDSFPPSQAFFNHSWNSVLVPMFKFLQSTNSYLMLNVYPYYDYMQSNGVIPLDYALFRPLPPTKEAVDANTLLHYTNVFDAVLDAAHYAMADLNFTNIPIVVMESGWPSKGDSSEPDATVDNANTYVSNLIRHVLNNTGTPKYPGVPVSTYIYELYNEDLRPGSVSEKNWGLFEPSGVPVYILHLTGSGPVLANDTTNQTYCVAKDGADRKLLQAALDWACGPGKVDCSPLLQGQPCYNPDTVEVHATYAFDTYYHQMGMASGTCYFNGVAAVTTTDPKHVVDHPQSGSAYHMHGHALAIITDFCGDGTFALHLGNQTLYGDNICSSFSGRNLLAPDIVNLSCANGLDSSTIINLESFCESSLNDDQIGHGSCIFPGSGGKNGTFVNGTSLAPSSNVTASGTTCHFSDAVTSPLIAGTLLLSVIFFL